ncbi:hypothetical protein [Ectobacillus panaciterrae]|uniref:hypothetical protein n=1 Tax=Ectobacillus panaciterrae TaxID=363872 RepID=UPI0012DD248C|nr:hypothetical protein [Ectobacillus panaciterrae]
MKHLKDELLERTKDSSISYSQMEEIYKHLRKIDLELKEYSIDKNNRMNSNGF